MEKVIVTICREYGSGGRIIGERVAERLGVPYYNRNLIDMAAKESGLAEGYINKFEEKVSSPFVWGIPMGRNGAAFSAMSGHYYSNEEKMYMAQSKIIRQVAGEGSCVIVGRLADYILEDEPGCIKVFIHGDKDARIDKAFKEYGYATRAEAEKAVKTIDKNRAAYHKKYADRSWSDCRNYHLCLNSTWLGADKCADIIVDAVSNK